ncbi:MAG: F0F1 ATP synthase subunit A [Caldithrix sp.]|nr:F0F1 ATP synthase subunit A [Caldithrix sp.]
MVSDKTTAVTDSVATHAEGGHQENIGEWIQHHIADSDYWHLPALHINLPKFESLHIFGLKLDLSISNHTVMLWIAGLILILLFKLTINYRKQVQKGFGNILEMLVIYIRDEVAIANMGEKEGRRFTPLLVTFFMFILTANLMGLIPLFTTATGNINVTAALAIVTLGATQVYGIKENGFWGYYKALVPHGVPWWLWPLMFIIEIMGLLARHVALTIRLFANMVAGHFVLFAFLGLIIIFKSYFISPVSIGFAIFVYFLELLVSLIQAYIFTLLSALFIGMSVNPEH